MKHYTLRALTHDVKVFNQLWLEYLQANKNRREDASAILRTLIGKLSISPKYTSPSTKPLTKRDIYETSH